MKNVMFTIWMLLYPLMINFNYKYLNSGKIYSDGVLALSTFIETVIWFVVGYLLYEVVK